MDIAHDMFVYDVKEKCKVESPAQHQERQGQEIPPVFDHQAGEARTSQAKTGQDQRNLSAQGKDC